MKLALIGDPVSHSRSPALHAAFLREAGIEGSYEALRVGRGAVAVALARLRDAGYLGVNVTTPHKEEAHDACDALSEVAREAAAVNTIIFQKGTIFGTNTDGDGARGAAELVLGSIAGLRALVLGVGPTGRAVALELQRAGATVEVWNRTQSRAEAFAGLHGLDTFSGDRVDMAFSTLPPGAEFSTSILHALKTAAHVFDANYGTRTTLAAVLGRAVTPGDAMLEAQARASFERWRAAGDGRS